MNKEKGTIIIIAVIAMTILMSISGYLISSLITEMEVLSGMQQSEKAYYLAESGINKAIWMLENNDEWADNFVDPGLNPDSEGNFWSENLTGELSEGSYEVEIQNTRMGEAQIRAIAKTPFMESEARREAEVTVYKPFESPTEDSAVFSGGGGSNVKISDTNLTINDGNLFSNHNLLLSGNTTLNLFGEDEDLVRGHILATQNINIGGNVDLEEYNAACSRNICYDECQRCPPDSTSLPTVDFDSDDEDSFKSRAQENQDEDNCSITCNPPGEDPYQCSDRCILSENELEDILWEVGKDGEIVFENEITYVTGSMNIKGGRSVFSEGMIVADRSIEVGVDEDWRRGGDRQEGTSHIEIINEDWSSPSGLLSKRSIKLGSYGLQDESVIEGAIYAGNRVELFDLDEKLTVKGGLMGRQFELINLQEGLEIDFEDELILVSLGYIIDDEIQKPSFAPVLEVDRWEEVY